jgi:hypothetical protein
VLQHTEASTRELFRLRHVCRAWKSFIGDSTPLKRRLFLVSASSDDQQPEDRWRPPGGINDLLFAGRPLGMVSRYRGPHMMALYCEDPDTTRPPSRPALELLSTVKYTVMSQMFLTQPPVSVIHATWSCNGMRMNTELENPAGVRVEDLIKHLEEFGRMSDGGKVVGMEIVTLAVTCHRKRRLRW